eukprot:341514-Ditylum_brightwellii.AAC.1
MVSERGPEAVYANREHHQTRHPTGAPVRQMVCAWNRTIKVLGVCCVEDGLQHTKLLGPWVVYNELGVRLILWTKWVELSPPRALFSSVGVAIGKPVQHWGRRLCYIETQID